MMSIPTVFQQESGANKGVRGGRRTRLSGLLDWHVNQVCM